MLIDWIIYSSLGILLCIIYIFSVNMLIRSRNQYCNRCTWSFSYMYYSSKKECLQQKHCQLHLGTRFFVWRDSSDFNYCIKYSDHFCLIRELLIFRSEYLYNDKRRRGSIVPTDASWQATTDVTRNNQNQREIFRDINYSLCVCTLKLYQRLLITSSTPPNIISTQGGLRH